jgi:hypothetical protein
VLTALTRSLLVLLLVYAQTDAQLVQRTVFAEATIKERSIMYIATAAATVLAAAAARVSAVQGDAAVTPGAVDVPMTCNQFLQLNTAADSGAEQSLCITCCGSSIIKKKLATVQ